MSGSSLANWDGSQSASNPKQSFNDDVRTSSFGVRLASTTSTETIKYDRTGAHLDASLTSMEDHHTVWRVGESNQNVSSMAAARTSLSTLSPLANNVNTSMDITRIFEEEGVIKRENYAESLYSVDAEGEPDDDQERTVSEMLMDTNDIRSITPVMITKASNQQHITPYPPPSLEHPDMSSPVLALGSLFTPPPSDQFDPPSPLTPSPPARKRYCLSYVAVPPFPEGRTRSDYIRVPQRKRVRAELHQTLGEALQASLDHNSRLNDLYTIRRDKEGSHLSKKKRQRHTQRNVVAGPSSTSVPRENFKVNRKRDREESHGDDIPRKKTKTHQNAERKHHTHEDLLSNRRSIYSRPRAHVMYEDGCLRLSVGSIPPVQVAVLNLNARFVLAATHAKEYGREKKENLAKSSREVEENRHGPKKSWFAWPPSRPSFLDAAREEYIAGGPVRQGTDAGSGEVTGEVLLDYMGARELSPEHSPRTKEREKRPLKRSIRAIEPLSNVIQPTPRPREPNASTSREPRPQLHQFRKEIPGFPSPSHRPRSQETRVVREASSARHDHGGEGKVLRKSTAQVIQETSPERHETSRERQPSASDRHHSRKPTSEVGQEPSPEQREASQENRIHPHKPDRATEETPSERYEAGQEGIVTPSDPPRPHKPSRATEEMPSERYEASQEGIVTPSDPPRPHKPSRRLGPKTPSGRREAGHEMVLPSPTRKPSITMNVVQETSSEHHGASQEGMLSAKALGKRRAVSPFDTRFGTDPPSPAPQLTVNQDELQTTSQQDLYVPTLSKGFASLSTDFFAPSTQLGTAPFMPQVPFSDPDNFLDCTLDSTSKTYDFDQPQIDDDELFLPQSITTHLGSLPTSPQFDEAMANPWLASSNASSISNPSPSAVYGDGTIDPSLLGGTQDVDLLHFTLPASPTLPYPPYPSAQSPSPWDKISPFRRSTSDSTRSPTPSTSSVSSVSPPSNPSSRSLFALVSRHSSPASEYVESKSVTTVPLRPPRPSRHSVRHVPADMVPTSEINVSSSEEDEPITRRMKRAKKSSAVPKQKLQSDSASDLESGRTKPKPKPKPKANSKWPLCDRHEFCHQCRSTTYKAKLRCPCGKKYCVRCLSTRYPGEFIYDPSRTTFTCPSCQNNCSCDICTRRRGEVYVSLRSHPERKQRPLQSPDPLIRSKRVKTKPKKEPELLTSASSHARPRSSLGGKTNLPPLSTTIPEAETYWATMYSVTGEKIGRAFVEEEGKNDVVIVRSLDAGKRVFVGAVQPSWGLGHDPVLKDLDPIPEKDLINRPRRRFYIGNEAILHYQTVPKATTILVNSESGEAEHNKWYLYDVISSPTLENDPLNRGEGECRQWPGIHESDLGMALQGGDDLFVAQDPGTDFSPDSLGDTDVARAITLGLMACGHGIEVQL